MIQHGVRWPFAVIDFEASSIDPERSYPVEAGVAVWEGPARPIRTWSTLIRPHPEWVRTGVWTQQAQDMHGITPTDLASAPPAFDVMSRLNAILSGVGGAVSDNPWWEDAWLGRLARAAGVPAAFHIDTLKDRVSGLRATAAGHMVDHLVRNPRPHRAGPDALGVVLALAAGIGTTPAIEHI